MKITPKTLSIPPFVSTSWRNIASLHLDASSCLIITLLNETRVEIPYLEPPILNQVFAAHAAHLEEETATSPTNLPPKHAMNSLFSTGTDSQILSFAFPLPEKGTENINTFLQHNPEQSETPPLPEGMLTRIAQLIKTLGISSLEVLPQPEPHCNCIHCQIARAIHDKTLHHEHAEEEELVTDEELKFRSWDIEHIGDRLFTVTNPSEPTEQYNVYLGEPVGCTCGEKHCEHIRAVLNS